MATQKETEESQAKLQENQPTNVTDDSCCCASLLEKNGRSNPPTDQHDPQTFRTAFIHSAAILFIFVCGVCGLLAYRILEPFLRSILWSTLAGAFLFPFKNHLTVTARNYLHKLDQDSHLLFYGLVILLPLRTIDRTIESIIPFALNKRKELTVILIVLVSLEWIQAGVVYHWLIMISYGFTNNLIFMIHILDSVWMITLIVPYLIAVLVFYESSPIVRNALNILAVPIWFTVLIYLSQFLPVFYRLILIMLSFMLMLVGFMVDLQEKLYQKPAEPHSTDDNQCPESTAKTVFNRFLSRSVCRDTHEQSSSTPSVLNSSASSTPYFSFILWALVAIKIYHFHWYLIRFLFFVLIYKTIKYILSKTYESLISQNTVQHLIQCAITFFQVRKGVLAPSPLPGLLRCLIKGDKKCNHGLQTSIDYIISAFIIVTVFISVLFGSILLVIQIQRESVHMIQLGGNLINETLVLQPSFQHMLPEKEDMSRMMDTAVNNFYSVGRSWIKTQIDAVSPQGSSNAKLEKDVLQLWDHLYNYMTNMSLLLLPDQNRSMATWSPNNSTFTMPNFHFNLSDLYGLVHNNIDFLRSVLESLWKNTTLLLTLLSTIISLLFTGGFVLLNFFVSFIVFVTVLFYLLSHSDKPIFGPTEWLNSTLPVGEKGVGKAVNDAVTSVFVASLKMAVFYGLYTYVLHTIVGSNLVFLPAVIASICAVTLKSYWAALPGCLEVWLVQQRPLGALVLLLGQIAPAYVVDTTIYSEVKGGGHQYLTALAIAGGVYYRGMEGALIGPIVLCCLLVGVKLYKENMTSTLSPSSEQTSSE